MNREKKIIINKLEGTTFSKELVGIARPIISETIKIFIADKSLEWTRESFCNLGKDNEIYAKQIFYGFSDLRESVEKLEQNVTFLSLKTIPSFYKKNRISEIDYYKYHIENHYIKITSIIDFTAKFINDVFRLGTPLKKCNVYLIFDNLNTKNTKPAKELKKFNAHFSELKEHRNIIIHRGNYSNESIVSLDSSLITIEVKDEVDKMIAKDFKKKKNEELQKIIDKMKKDNENVSNFLFDIFEGLTPYFKIQHDFLLNTKDKKQSR